MNDSHRYALKFCLINFLSWAVLSLILSSLVFWNLNDSYSVKWSAFYLSQLPWWISASVIAPVVYYAILKFKSSNFLIVIIVHLCLLLLIVTLFNTLRALIAALPALTLDSFLQAANRTRLDDFVSNFFIYLILSVAIHAVVAFRDKKEAEADRNQISKLLTEARLELLTRQLQPHFLFNALNTIASLIRKQENHEAIKAIDSLGNLLRVCIEQNTKVTVSLEEELRLINHYILIESIRFQGRLKVESKIDDEALSVPVPLLILQPIVENAIKHGISKIGKTGLVWITVSKIQNNLTISVEDNGPGIDTGVLHEGVGIKNTQERLKNLYQDNSSFSITNRSEGGTRVLLNLPIPLL